jgi:hypothetical protein
VTEATPTPVIATVTGKELLDKLDSLTASVTQLTAKLDDIPHTVADHEQRVRKLEGERFVTWPQLAGVLSLLMLALTAVAAFLALR